MRKPFKPEDLLSKVKRMAGTRLHQTLNVMTGNRFRGVGTGVLITRAIQSRFTHIFALLLLAMVSIHCAPESRLLRKENAADYRARTYRDGSGAHGYNEIVVFPTDSLGKEYRCPIKPECLKLDKDKEKPEPQDCVDWSKPCDELR